MMALPQIITRNSIQTIPSTPLTGRVVVLPNTWYTCPTGKKAIITGKAMCTGLGAAANVALTGAGVILVNWQASAVSERILIIDTYFSFVLQLAAGETLVGSQDSGTNGEMNLIAQVQESPI